MNNISIRVFIKLNNLGLDYRQFLDKIIDQFYSSRSNFYEYGVIKIPHILKKRFLNIGGYQHWCGFARIIYTEHKYIKIEKL